MMHARLILAPDLASTIAQAGVDPTLEGRAMQDAIVSAIADRRGYLPWGVDLAGWLVLQRRFGFTTLNRW